MSELTVSFVRSHYKRLRAYRDGKTVRLNVEGLLLCLLEAAEELELLADEIEQLKTES